MRKFNSLNDAGDDVAHRYGNHYFRQSCPAYSRLVIGPSGAHVAWLDALSALFPGNRYYLLYVLLLSHASRWPGRYESPLIGSHEELQRFLCAFQEFLEGDGRHHLWIATPDSPNLIVYDHHDLIFAYGDLDMFESALHTAGFKCQEFWIPTPHIHYYPPANVQFEDGIFEYFDWKYFELQPADTWDEVEDSA